MQGHQSSVQRDIKIRSVSTLNITLTKPRLAGGLDNLEFIKSSSQLFLLQDMGQISDDLSKYFNQCLILILLQFDILPTLNYILRLSSDIDIPIYM